MRKPPPLQRTWRRWKKMMETKIEEGFRKERWRTSSENARLFPHNFFICKFFIWNLFQLTVAFPKRCNTQQWPGIQRWCCLRPYRGYALLWVFKLVERYLLGPCTTLGGSSTFYILPYNNHTEEQHRPEKKKLQHILCHSTRAKKNDLQNN